MVGWIQARQKPLGIIVGVILLALVVLWYLGESGRRKEQQAAEALDQARATMETGNFPEASTQFQRVIEVYSGTDAAYEAVLNLNQVRMLSGQSQLAIEDLQRFIASKPPGRFEAAAQSHIGMALENTGKPAEAAAAYLAAARVAEEPYVQADALLSAARAYRASGSQDAARQTLEDLIRRYPAESPAVVEAKIRLAELTGGKI